MLSVRWMLFVMLFLHIVSWWASWSRKRCICGMSCLHQISKTSSTMLFQQKWAHRACGGEHAHEGLLKVIDIVQRGVKMAGFMLASGKQNNVGRNDGIY